MYTIKINENKYDVVPENGDHHTGTVNGKTYEMDMAQKDATNWIINKDGEEHRIEIANLDTDNKVATIRINGRKYAMKLTDQFDTLLKDLGLEGMAVKKISEIKSPMPGLVLDILVQPGDVIKKGDQVLVLEAMKMENIIKSQTDAVVKSVPIEKGVAVEKGQVLVKFE
ncbi:MAG: biotin carboxyl carrier protein [Salibacteraceae bacterium]|jgi:biotin carboxyl carrier protein